MKVSKLVRFGAVLAMVFAVTAMTATNASAAAMLRLTDMGSSTSVTITDNGVGDSNAAIGAVTFIGSLANWLVNVSTGLTKPILVGQPDMDLSSVNTSTAAGTLVIEFTDTDWTGLGGAAMRIGGTANGPVTYEAYYDATNTPFGQGLLIDSLGPFATGAFSGSGGGPLGLISPYSATQVVTIVHGRGVNNTSFDAELVPEPASLALLGLGLFGAAMSARRRNRA